MTLTASTSTARPQPRRTVKHGKYRISIRMTETTKNKFQRVANQFEEECNTPLSDGVVIAMLLDKAAL
jgi:hypothetical protein